jgi:hypothetical protein
MIILPFFSYGQVNESFLDGNFINNPIWTGTTSNFTVNNSLQLQSQAATTSTSFLFTSSEAFDDAVWECWVKITYPTSSSNYAAVYIASDNNDITAGCNGYYVQIGGTNDEVSLFVQEGTKKTKIIDGTDKRTDGSTVELRIKVTRDSFGNFCLYSKLVSESDFVLEGTVQNNTIKQSSYFGLLFSNTSTTGSAYYFDDIDVTGNRVIDNVFPEWISLNLLQPDKLVLGFSEAMDFSEAAYNVNQDIGSPTSQNHSTDNKTITLTFDKNFEKSIIYDLKISGLKDLAGNILPESQRSIGIPEPILEGDLVFNEVMFENALNSLEYIEIYNRSDKLLDISGLVFTTRKTDGTLNTGNKIPAQTLLNPNGYLALCSNADSIRNYHNCPEESNIIITGWSTLNNQASTLVLANAAKDTIYDELAYNVKWHHALVKNPKGVALERINPALPSQDRDSWHSAASEVNYGTPGYLNSQYRDINSEPNKEKTVWVEPEAFSPDNDGTDDVCFIKYKTEESGYVANVLILNPTGIKMYAPATNLLLSAEGFLTWDGKTESGKNVNPGIYVLYFEMFNTINGKRKQIKLPIVVSSR